MAGKKKNWIRGAVDPSHKGVFSSKAKAAGKTTPEFAAEKADAPGKLGKQARLAQTFEGMASKHAAHKAALYTRKKG